MEMLSSEKDRRRRSQIMEAIRSYGNAILPKLAASLDSDKWYLVRNTLILVAEMADDSCFEGVVNCLGHSDKRVQRAAVRTLWRGYGNRAAEPFLKIARGSEPEMLEEILFGLAQISTPGAIHMALDYASDVGNPDRLRTLALNVLVANPSSESMPALVEFVRRKGLVISTAEPIAIRIAAAKAMLAVGGEGRKKLMEIVGAEPNGAEKDELAKLLDIGNAHARRN
jgi:HEAT repeat protein